MGLGKLLKLSASDLPRGSARPLLSVHETQADADRAYEESHFLLNQLETHGQQRESNEQIQSTENQLLLSSPSVETCARHVVAEADRRQCDETEIEADQKVPVVGVIVIGVSCQQTQRYTNTSRDSICCVLCTLKSCLCKMQGSRHDNRAEG